MTFAHTRRRLPDRDRRARIAPVAAPSRAEVAQHEIALGERPITRRASNLGRPRAADEIGCNRRPPARLLLDRRAHEGPQLQLGHARPRVLTRRPLPHVRQGERRPQQGDLVVVLDCAGKRELRSCLDRSQPGGEGRRQRGALRCESRAGRDLRERPGGAACRIDGAQSVAGIGDDLAVQRGCGILLVLADDQDRQRAGGQNGERQRRERARPGLDLGGEAGEPGHRRRMGSEQAVRAVSGGDLECAVATGRQKVTVTPPSTVNTCPVTYVLRSHASQATCWAISAGSA